MAEPAVRRTTQEHVHVHGSDVHVERAHFDLPLAEARSRYGGTSVPSVLAGALAGLGSAVLLGALASGVGAEVGQAAGTTALAVGGLVTALVVVALSALVAGWVAGRCARFDGARNGLLAGVLMALLLAGLGAAGSYTAAESGLPVSFDGDRVTTAAIVGGLLALAAAALAGLLGGRLGVRWHRDVDDVLLGTRAGAVATASTLQDVR